MPCRLSHVAFVDYVDFILNLAGLLLWLNWRVSLADPLDKRRRATKIGPAVGWNGKLDLAVATPFFRSNLFSHMVLFSIFSFARMLGIVYLWLLLLSILSGPEPVHRLVRIPLGRIDRWPRWSKFLLPLLVTALVWGRSRGCIPGRRCRRHNGSKKPSSSG